MLKFIDGFDHYTATGVTGATLQPYLEAAGYTVRNATATTFSVVDGRQAGQKALQFTVAANASVVPSLSWGFSSPTATKVVFGFAIKASGTRMRVARIENILDLNWNATTGKLEAQATSGGAVVVGTAVLILNAWYFIEIVVDSTADTISVYANDELQLTLPYTDTPSGTYTITWGQTATQTVAGVQIIDDLYALDNVGGTRIDRLGPSAVATRLPTADVTKEWTPVGQGAVTTHYTIAGQLSALATNAPYLQSNTNGATDEFSSNNVLPNNNEVWGVGIVALARKGDLDARSLGLKMTVSGTPSETQVVLTESYKYLQATLETPPGGGTWSQNAIESSTFGIVTR
jgi:hypothetical protein